MTSSSWLKPLARRCFTRCVPALRRVADAVGLRGRLVEAALGEELPAGHRLGGGELLEVVGGRQPVRLDVAGALRGLPARRRAALLVAQLHAVAAGQPLDGLDERQVLGAADEADDVAGLAAAEAHVVAEGRVDVERRRLLVVEGAQALQPAAAGRAQLHGLADDVGDRCPLAHEDDVLVTDAPSHFGVLPPPRRARAGTAGWGTRPGRSLVADGPSRAAVHRPSRARSARPSRACSPAAAASVSPATWSTTTRSRAASSRRRPPALRRTTARAPPGARSASSADELGDDLPLAVLHLAARRAAAIT